MTLKLVSLLLVACLAAAGLLAADAGSASAAVSCGKVLSQDTTLTQNLTCAAGPALVFGHGGISLDLNGHSVTIMNDSVAVLDSGKNRIKILGPGVIAGPPGSSGVVVLDASNVEIHALDFHADDAATGIFVRGGHGSEISDNDFVGGQVSSAVSLVDHVGGLISGNTIRSGTQSVALSVNGGGSNTIRQNHADGAAGTNYADTETVGDVWELNTGLHAEIYNYYFRSQNTIVARNVGNHSDGFGFLGDQNISDGSVPEFVGNVAIGNAFWGFFALAPAGGHGNFANGNGVGECFNVPCHSH